MLVKDYLIHPIIKLLTHKFMYIYDACPPNFALIVILFLFYSYNKIRIFHKIHFMPLLQIIKPNNTIIYSFILPKYGKYGRV